MAQNVGTVYVTVVDNPMQAFADAGWEFSYDEATRFIRASHPLRGAFSVCEVSRFTRGLGERPITFDELGHAIAAWLNRKSEA
jgi:hypothetical protein